MSRADGAPRIREVVGVFLDGARLESAAQELLDAGFEARALGVLAREEAAAQSFGPVRVETPGASEGSRANRPSTEFVRRESVGDTLHAWVGGFSLAGTTALGATAVASAAVLGGALVAAAAGAAALGAVGAAMAAILRKSDAEYLEEQVDKGRLLLFARTQDAAQQRRALRTLKKHEALETKTLTLRAR
ncbi:MAG TPA: hypothetical protein VFV10_10065 [Gammaproteobacteria bacterium]|nr:hypothetical protein [Gammaproteobacteria bacterium]